MTPDLIFASKFFFEGLELPVFLDTYLCVQTEVKAHPDQEGIEFLPRDGALKSSRFDKFGKPNLQLRDFAGIVPSSSLHDLLSPSDKDSANGFSWVLRFLPCEGF